VTTDNPNYEDEFNILSDVVSGFDQEVYRSDEARACALLRSHAAMRVRLRFSLRAHMPPPALPQVRRKLPRFAFLKDYTEFLTDDYYHDDPWAAMQYQSVAKRFVVSERFHAIRAALGMAADGDAVVLLGKGAEDFQLVEGSKHWFQDAAEARAALKVLPKRPKSLDMRVLPYRIADWPAEINNYIE
jgi:UDP-N-acetylmuramyl tripeptide synthase